MSHLWRVIAFLVCVLPAVCNASIPQTSGYRVRESEGPTKEAACQAAVAATNPYGIYKSFRFWNVSGSVCNFIGVDKDGADATAFSYGISSISDYCPANSTKSGTSCSCNAGFNEKDGQCVKSDSCSALANYCSSKKGSSQNYALWDSAADTFCYVPPDDFHWDQPKFPGCNQGCMGDAIGMTVGAADASGRMVYRGEGRLTGGKCTEGTGGTSEAPGTKGTDKDPAVNDSACAGFKGTVGDKVVCIPATSATGVDWTGTTNNSDGTKSETTTSTTCANGVCETTRTTTNKDSSGNTTGTSTSTERHSQVEYCSKNPASQVCAAVNANPVPGKDNTNGGNGNGTGGGTGSGNCNISNCSDTGGGGPGKVGFPGTGAGGEIGQLYQPKYPDGPVKLWNDKSATLKSSGLGSLALKLFPQVPGGGMPPQWVVDFDFGPLGSLGMHDISPPQWLWDVLKAIVILTALITARRLIFGG